MTSAFQPVHHTALSVNLNKVALVRNTRHLGIPSVTRAATLCLQAGARGITVHPRPDERHIRRHDVFDLAELLTAWPDREYNIEGNPFHNLMDVAREVKARGLPLHQLTLVPDSEGQFTSDHGWAFPADAERLRPLIAEAHALGLRVSLFMDAEPDQMAEAMAVGADRVELYTEPYAAAWQTPQRGVQLERFRAAAQAALDVGLGVNAGHDLNRDNLTAFLSTVPGVSEVSIGHALIADALESGYSATIADYIRCITERTPDMIHGIGTDICDVRRIEATLERQGERFVRKVLTDAEFAVWQQRSARWPHRGLRYLATRFSAKEAFSKAVGMGMRLPMTWRSCEITNLPSGQPVIVLHGDLKTWFEAQGLRAHVTVTDETDYAASFVVVEKD